ADEDGDDRDDDEQLDQREAVTPGGHERGFHDGRASSEGVVGERGRERCKRKRWRRPPSTKYRTGAFPGRPHGSHLSYRTHGADRELTGIFYRFSAPAAGAALM